MRNEIIDIPLSYVISPRLIATKKAITLIFLISFSVPFSYWINQETMGAWACTQPTKKEVLLAPLLRFNSSFSQK